MSKLFERLVLVASLAALVVCGFYANRADAFGKLNLEIQRYNLMNSRFLLFVGGFIVFCFAFGYVFSRSMRSKVS